jgi:hypothetical protein
MCKGPEEESARYLRTIREASVELRDGHVGKEAKLSGL